MALLDAGQPYTPPAGGRVFATAPGRTSLPTPASVLLELARQRPGWHAEAACRGVATAVFFPGRGEPADLAKTLCELCPVREACADYATPDATLVGVWGGMSEKQRRRLRAARRRGEAA